MLANPILICRDHHPSRLLANLPDLWPQVHASEGLIEMGLYSVGEPSKYKFNLKACGCSNIEEHIVLLLSCPRIHN